MTRAPSYGAPAKAMDGEVGACSHVVGSDQLPQENAPVVAQNSCPKRKKSKPGLARILWSGFRFMLHGHEKNFVVNPVKAAEYARSRFAALLRAPFPGESDAEVARQWAPKLGRSEQTILNWLAGKTSASIEDLVAVVAMHGIWDATRIFLGEETRNEVLNKIGR